MRSRIYCRKTLSIVFIGLLLITGLYACHDGGSSSSMASPEQEGYGKVGILMVSAPDDAFTQYLAGAVAAEGNLLRAGDAAEDYDHLWITITDVTLIPDDDDAKGVVIFDNPDGYTIDLLAYRDESFLFPTNEQIPAGRYEKIRLGISDIRAQGGPCEDMGIKLPSNKIDFIPEGDFVVRPGGNLNIKVTVVKIHEAGDSEKCIFHPTIRGEIISDEPICFWRHAYKGIIAQVLDRNADGRPDGFLIDELDGLEVRLVEDDDIDDLDEDDDDDTAIFTEIGEFGDPSVLHVGQEVIVRGIMDPAGILYARLVIIGDALTLKGTVMSDVGLDSDDEAGTFELLLDTGQALFPSVQVLVYPRTIICSGCDDDEDLDDIEQHSRLIVVGKYDTILELFKAAGILILSDD